MKDAMTRRDFIKSGPLAAAAGAITGPKAIAHEAEKQTARERMSKDILNYNPKMQYRPMGRTGVNVSALGFGMLRLPMKDGHVDFDRTTPMVHRAIEGGVNYIDTGRVYIGGESEQAVGKALAGGWRNRVYVTSKMPSYRHAPGHIGCTGCYQCIPCPHNVAIGYIFAYVYNNYLLHRNMDRAMADYTVSMSPVQRGDPASSCVSCGECLAKCPQHLDIPSLLAKVKETMGK